MYSKFDPQYDSFDGAAEEREREEQFRRDEHDERDAICAGEGSLDQAIRHANQPAPIAAVTAWKKAVTVAAIANGLYVRVGSGTKKQRSA